MQLRLARFTGAPVGAAVPALGELRLRDFAAFPAGPRAACGCGLRTIQDAERIALVSVIHENLRPGFHHGQVAHGSGRILITQFALNTGCDKYVARMGDL